MLANNKTTQLPPPPPLLLHSRVVLHTPARPLRAALRAGEGPGSDVSQQWCSGGGGA